MSAGDVAMPYITVRVGVKKNVFLLLGIEKSLKTMV
jgi:hypothetical protein